MSLNESIVEDAAFAMPRATFTPAIPEEARATDKKALSVQNTSKGG